MKEKVQVKLDTLTKERDGVVANLNAYNGAIEVLKQLLADEVAPALTIVPAPTEN